MFPFSTSWSNIGLICVNKKIYDSLETILPFLPREIKRYIYWKEVEFKFYN